VNVGVGPHAHEAKVSDTRGEAVRRTAAGREHHVAATQVLGHAQTSSTRHAQHARSTHSGGGGIVFPTAESSTVLHAEQQQLVVLHCCCTGVPLGLAAARLDPKRSDLTTHPVQHALGMQVLPGSSYLERSQGHDPQVWCAARQRCGCCAEPATNDSILCGVVWVARACATWRCGRDSSVAVVACSMHPSRRRQPG
jgi:hypothetical protein